MSYYSKHILPKSLVLDAEYENAATSAGAERESASGAEKQAVAGRCLPDVPGTDRPRRGRKHPHLQHRPRGGRVGRSGRSWPLLAGPTAVSDSRAWIGDCVFHPGRTSFTNDWVSTVTFCERTQSSIDKYVPDRQVRPRSGSAQRDGASPGSSCPERADADPPHTYTRTDRTSPRRRGRPAQMADRPRDRNREPDQAAGRAAAPSLLPW